MLLQSIEIANYRGFGSSQEVEFADPANGSGLTVLVGPNNSGKSTVLKTIRHLVSDDDVFVAGSDDRRAQALKITLKGKNDKDFEIGVSGRGSAARLKKEGKWAFGIGNDIIYVPARRPWNDRFHAHQFGEDHKKQHETGFYNNLRQQEFYVDAAFGASMALIEITASSKREFTQLLTKFEPTIEDWTIDNRDQDFISYKSVSGASHRIGLVGDGVSNIFRLAYALYDFKRGSILLLDEPELSLHPQAQRRLYEELRKLAKTGQIVISTHSPHFVSWQDIQSGAKVYRANLVKHDGTQLTTLSRETIRDIGKVADEKKNRKLYDVVAREVFFSRGTLFVEGQEDAHIIANYVQENTLPDIEIFGYGAGGASLIGGWLRLARQLGIRAAAIFDGDPEGVLAFKKCSLEFLDDEQVWLRKLPTPDIRDKLDNGVEGIFDERWQIKEQYMAEWNALLSECEAFLRS
ncbi:ATP-dependent endonuclease [Bradyrhizobium sp. JYMT SZCCT0428]|uniref:ATP-dependent nuclease n=1 Tax=Bradyrhizobium sp. JYMT SZCCT0428 TaxID=2807673 RepID=UPI001BAB41C9|nr:AAA family ATPase [Bradyrhizobium sp. JYMT SZCCT0428]MBR1155094.1 AAA family ATPase [Bradyrhizobium sp. JYMT SZCCT0428]